MFEECGISVSLATTSAEVTSHTLAVPANNAVEGTGIETVGTIEAQHHAALASAVSFGKAQQSEIKRVTENNRQAKSLLLELQRKCTAAHNLTRELGAILIKKTYELECTQAQVATHHNELQFLGVKTSELNKRLLGADVDIRNGKSKLSELNLLLERNKESENEARELLKSRQTVVDGTNQAILHLQDDITAAIMERHTVTASSVALESDCRAADEAKVILHARLQELNDDVARISSSVSALAASLRVKQTALDAIAAATVAVEARISKLKEEESSLLAATARAVDDAERLSKLMHTSVREVEVTRARRDAVTEKLMTLSARNSLVEASVASLAADARDVSATAQCAEQAIQARATDACRPTCDMVPVCATASPSQPMSTTKVATDTTTPPIDTTLVAAICTLSDTTLQKIQVEHAKAQTTLEVTGHTRIALGYRDVLTDALELVDERLSTVAGIDSRAGDVKPCRSFEERSMPTRNLRSSKRVLAESATVTFARDPQSVGCGVSNRKGATLLRSTLQPGANNYRRRRVRFEIDATSAVEVMTTALDKCGSAASHESPRAKVPRYGDVGGVRVAPSPPPSTPSPVHFDSTAPAALRVSTEAGDKHGPAVQEKCAAVLPFARRYAHPGMLLLKQKHHSRQQGGETVKKFETCYLKATRPSMNLLVNTVSQRPARESAFNVTPPSTPFVMNGVASKPQDSTSAGRGHAYSEVRSFAQATCANINAQSEDYLFHDMSL